MIKQFQMYMSNRKALLPLSMVLSAFSALAGMALFVFIWLIVKELLSGADAYKIIVLENGNVAESGTPEELKKRNGIFSKMVKQQTAHAN